MLIILTGKTASGKDTIISALLQKYPDFKKIITTTSRIPRDNEQDDIDYHFLTRDQFKKKIASAEFAEYVEYGGNLYGTYKAELKKALSQNTLWKIDPSRAGKIRQLIKRDLLVIYITVSDEVVLERLRKRNLSEEEIDKRMADDAAIWQEFGKNYDYVVENVPGHLNQTLDKIVAKLNYFISPA